MRYPAKESLSRQKTETQKEQGEEPRLDGEVRKRKKRKKWRRGGGA